MTSGRMRPLATAVVALGLAATFACTRSTPRATTAPPEPLTRLTIEAGKPVDPLTPADSFNKPAVGTRYVAIPLTIRAREKLTVEPARWIRASTRSGTTLQPAVLQSQPGDISAGGPTLGRLDPGQDLQGVLIYEVPLGDSVTDLTYQDDLAPPQRGSVRVP